MEYALVDAGVVVDVIVADSSFIQASGDEVKSARQHPSGSWVACPENQKVGIGYTWDGTTFTDPNAPAP